MKSSKRYFFFVDNYDMLSQKAVTLGADLFGATQTSKLYNYLNDEIIEIARSLPYTISIAVRIQPKVFESLVDRPNLIYKAHYRQANNLLDRITFQLGQFIQSQGFEAMPIPASVITDWQNQRSHLSHRHVAARAGLGFFGRSGLLINPEYGAAIRLASLLTNMPVRIDSPLEADCGNCYACIAACPAGAISAEGLERFDGKACYDLLRQFLKRRGIGVMICGLCIKACMGKQDDR